MILGRVQASRRIRPRVACSHTIISVLAPFPAKIGKGFRHPQVHPLHLNTIVDSMLSDI